MNAAPDVATVETPDDDARIAAVLSLLSDSDFCELKSILQKRFGLEYAETSAHPYNIKTTITGKKIVFSKGVSAASRAFMVLHSLGHYYFICEARRKKIERYSYIYDLRGTQATLHYYETESRPNALEQPPEMSDQKRKDRVSFEVSANNFALSLLETIGFAQGRKVIQQYAAGDIHYIVDVSRGGKAAIAHSDRDYIQHYVAAHRSIDPADMYDEGVYEAAHFDVDAIDWAYLDDIKLEIHFF